MNSKLKFKIKNYKTGFTLIELLVVLGVLLVVGSILISILISSLRGTNKVNSLDNVRTKGNYALEQMGKMIRYSQSFNGISTDGVRYKRDCTPPPIASVYTPPIYAFAPAPRLGFFSKLASLIQGFGNLGKREVSGLFSKLAILIPESFRSKSTPKREVAGVTNQLGQSSSFASSSNTVNSVYVSTVDVPSGKIGTVTTGKMYIAGGTTVGTVNVYMVVYNGNDGTRIAVSPPIAITSASISKWYDFTFPSFNVSAGDRIWLGWYADDSGTSPTTTGPNIYWDASVIGDYSASFPNYRYKDWGAVPVPDPFGAATVVGSTRSWAEYLNVVAPDPDLRVNGVFIDNKTIYSPGEAMTFHVITSNVSSVNVSSGFNVATNVNAPATQPACSPAWNNYSVSPLNAGAMDTHSGIGAVAPSTPGNYLVGAYVDSDCSIAESSNGTAGVTNNGDNYSTATYTVSDPAATPTPTTAPTPTPTPLLYHYIKITGFDNGQTILSCIPYDPTNSLGLNVNQQIASYSGSLDSIPVNLIDTSSVNIDSCSITCTQDTVVSPQTVTIQFNLSNISQSGFSENRAVIPFQTSITVRNY